MHAMALPREYVILKSMILQWGGNTLEAQEVAQPFGSAYSVFVVPCGGRLRLVWDGREGWVLLQSLSLGGRWTDVITVVHRDMVEEEFLVSNLRSIIAQRLEAPESD